MLISVHDLVKEPLAINVALPEGAIEFGPEVRQIGPLEVKGRADLIEEHRGHGETVDDIRLRGSYSGNAELLCARCLDPVQKDLHGDFDLLFRPEAADADASERAITEDETEIGYYGKSGLLLEDAVREQVLLGLPGRTLCREDCRGLCPRCGVNRNHTTCSCDESRTDQRWNALAGLAEKTKP